MKALNNRLEKLEAIHAPKKEIPAAWIAIVAIDGTVSASHVKHGKHEFANIDEFEVFRKEKGIIEGDFIQVIIVNSRNCKGEKPTEL